MTQLPFEWAIDALKECNLHPKVCGTGQRLAAAGDARNYLRVIEGPDGNITRSVELKLGDAPPVLFDASVEGLGDAVAELVKTTPRDRG